MLFLCVYSFKKNVHITLIHLREGELCQFADCFVHMFAYNKHVLLVTCHD